MEWKRSTGAYCMLCCGALIPLNLACVKDLLTPLRVLTLPCVNCYKCQSSTQRLCTPHLFILHLVTLCMLRQTWEALQVRPGHSCDAGSTQGVRLPIRHRRLSLYRPGTTGRTGVCACLPGSCLGAMTACTAVHPRRAAANEY